jgi:beta-lactamase superfamily II metal-dependent hydrolase
MKRVVLSILILSLVALPMFGASKQKLTTARCASLEHIAGGWRMVVNCDQGKGAIVMLDTGKQYRGSGVFAGWSQEQMNATYQSLLPTENSPFELLQLG